jgi:hypothetical protein
MDPKKFEAIVTGTREVVVGSVVLMLNTDDADDLRNGFMGKIIGDEYVNGERLFIVRWANGDQDDGIKPGWVAHV